MSANHKSRDGFTFASDVSQAEWAIIESMFDQQVDYDIQRYKIEARELKLFKQQALVKILTFPVTYLVTWCIMDQWFADDIWLTAKVCWKLLRNKICTTKFKEELDQIAERPQDFLLACADVHAPLGPVRTILHF